MNLDELTFANRQLADLLKSGVPLEGSLHQLCSTMSRGELRTELQALEKDLTKGVALKEALDRRKLPDFYVKMIKVGIKSNNLPEVLTMLADYYSQVNNLQTRLKGLLVYPAITLGVMLALTLFVAYVNQNLVADMFFNDQDLSVLVSSTLNSSSSVIMLWSPVILIALLVVSFLVCLGSGRIRRSLRWQLPGFREASLSQIASTMSIMLRGGCTLDESLHMVCQMEKGNPSGVELAQWHERMAAGQGKLREIFQPGRVFPLEFIWMLGTDEEKLVRGFERTSELYYDREKQCTSMLLHGVVPIAIAVLGMVAVIQTIPLILVLTTMMEHMGP
ncbi:MAG: type II secretion system F family protein [Verrucomicrobiota bacterium]|nr:type II secretion system F family protein [Verrucomicrobiota bacterium]